MHMYTAVEHLAKKLDLCFASRVRARILYWDKLSKYSHQLYIIIMLLFFSIRTLASHGIYSFIYGEIKSGIS